MEEILYVVDDKDQFVRKVSRKEVIENALIHRTARVIIFNNKGLFLVQKRSMRKDMYPGYWDIGMAGTVIENDGYVGTALRELMEELDIIGVSNIQLMHSFLFKIKYRSSENNVNCKVYKLNYDGKLIVQKEEIDDVKFMTLDNLKKLITKENFHPVGKIVLEKYLETENNKG